MDRIRKALDLARLERSQLPDLAFDPPAAPEPIPEGPVRAKSRPTPTPIPTSIVYSRTQVFAPNAAVLERNRVLNPASRDAAAAAFRMLRTQVLQRMDERGWRSLAVFSPAARDGKTTTAVNLAVSLANDRLHTVLLVDFDFKHPTVATRLGLAPQLGSDDAICGRARVEECLYHPEGFDRLVIFPARATLENSSEMLAGPRGREIVAELRGRYPDRIVIFDLPPVLSADDALAFAPLVECGIIVAAEGQTRRDDLVRSIELLKKTPLVGTVLNRAAEAVTGY